MEKLSKGKYRVTPQSIWQGRTDSLLHERFFQVIECIDLQQGFPTQSAPMVFALVGFCCDEGIRRNQGRVGAAAGPQALRSALAKLPLFRIKDTHYYDLGDVICDDGDLESAQALLGEIVCELLRQNIKPIILGGGHEIAWGHYQGIMAANQHSNLGILNFDAHFDIRPLLNDNKGTSGTPFLQIANTYQAHQLKFHYNCIGIQTLGNTRSLFEQAKRLGVNYLSADEIHVSSAAHNQGFIDDFTKGCQKIYLSICLDVFASAFAPGVSAPQVAGIYPWHVIPLLQSLARTGKILSFDVAELSPHYDNHDMTAKLGATLISEFIHYCNLN